MNDELETANAEVVIGIEAEKFLESHIGQYLVGCGIQDEEHAIISLLDFNPYDYSTLGELQTALAKLQQDVHIARKVQGYLTDAIVKGTQAEEIIINNEE